MIINYISDLRGHYPDLFPGHLLIVVGDVIAVDTLAAAKEFINWLYEQPYKKCVWIVDDHDTLLTDRELRKFILARMNFLGDKCIILGL